MAPKSRLVNTMKSWFIIAAFAISLAMHFGTGIYVYLIQLPSQPHESIDVTILNGKFEKLDETDEDKKARQIVEQDEKRVNNELDKNAKFLSRYNQRVAKETKAAKVGKFQNDAKEGQVEKKPTLHAEQKNQTKEKKQRKATKQKNLLTAEFSDVTLPSISALKPQFHWDNVQVGVPNPGPVSQTDDHLKEVETGPQTLLSSREFVYYSYYSRIKERLRIFWEPKIKEKITRLFMSGRHLASAEERITKLVITLDRAGKLIRVQVLGESGLKDLDDAAVEAFQAAAPFPNPPTGIVENDGTIKIRWDFILEANDTQFSDRQVFTARQ